MLQDELHFLEAKAMAEVKTQCCAHVSYTKLKRRYKLLRNRCNQLVEPNIEEEAVKQRVVRTACIKAFLLLLLGYTIFCRQEQHKR